MTLTLTNSVVKLIALGLALACATGPVRAKSIEIEHLPAMEVLGPAKAPWGYLDFCKETSSCDTPLGDAVRVILTTEVFDELDRLNRHVNATVIPATDMEIYGTAEKWAYPIDRGDCEDYVLLKRRMLAEAGWPLSALLITVVRDEKGDGHAVLTVVTDHGDLILDNQKDDILAWQRTPYDYVKRQSQTVAKAWVFIGRSDLGTGVATTR